MAVTVDQHECGDYTWRILDSTDGLCEFKTLVEGAVSFDTYIGALRAGCDALAALCADPLIGPVHDVDNERF